MGEDFGMKENDVQVDSDHYYGEYDDKLRWFSYWYQIQEVLDLEPESVLEVGIGNKTVSSYLENRGLDITTVDIDSELDPDAVCDVRELSEEFDKDSFDVVLCAEVLEHLPFEDFERALKELKKVAKEHVVLTLPSSVVPFNVFVKVPKLNPISFSLSLPFPVKHEAGGEHYWEINKRGYGISKVKKKISKYFDIEKEYKIPENSYHRIFVLKPVKE